MSNSEHNQNISQSSGSYPKNSLNILEEYLETLTKKTTVNDTRNSVSRYLIPSLGGPVPTAAKRRPISPKEVEAALSFLKDYVTLQQLADSPDLALKTLDQLKSAPAQRERVRRNLRDLVDWAREQQYLPLPQNLIPDNLCDGIQVGKFSGCVLRPATARQIYEEFYATLNYHQDKTDLINALIRHFIPGCKGPIPYHKPALESEIDAGLQYLESIPLEYLSEAPQIASQVLEIYGLTLAHGTRMRHILKLFVDWAREHQYLPDPDRVAPWGGDHISPRMITDLEAAESVILPKTVAQSYQDYCQYLEQANTTGTVKSFQSAVIRYLVPACGGSRLQGNKATQDEVQAGLAYLQFISLKQLDNMADLLEVEFESVELGAQHRRSVRSRLNSWLQWHIEQGYSPTETEPEPEFNTFYTPGVVRSLKRYGREIYRSNENAVHTLCAREFPDDYVNSRLKRQIEEYKQFRLRTTSNRAGIAPGTLKTELEFIYQVMGWLHREEGVPLEKLRFQALITVSKLRFRIDEKEHDYYLRWKEKGRQRASDNAQHDLLRVKRYLEFTGTNPNSQKRRLSNIIAISKFLYRDLIGTDDCPDDKDIPVIRRLLQYQKELSASANQTPSSIPYQKTSLKWQHAIEAMLRQRLRADQMIVFFRSPGHSSGYQKKRRSDRAMAHELQRFLSLALCLLVPSRSRTFYDLRIGETFKEGILTESEFLSVEQLKEHRLWEQYQDKIRFYIHHLPEDYKTGKNMSRALLDNGGWWAEIPNVEFRAKTLYDYIRRWLNWGRILQEPVSDNFFFRGYHTNQPLDGSAWNARIRSLFNYWTSVPVPPKNIRKMYASQFHRYSESSAHLMQHSERIQRTVYDMRLSIEQIRPVMDENVKLIELLSLQFDADEASEHDKKN